MFKDNKEIYIYTFDNVDNIVKSLIYINGRFYRYFDSDNLKVCNNGHDYIFFSNDYQLISSVYDYPDEEEFTIVIEIIKKLSNTSKIFKQFRTYEFIKSKMKKFILKVKERFYNPDTPNNFMKKHANKYVNTLGTLPL